MCVSVYGDAASGSLVVPLRYRCLVPTLLWMDTVPTTTRSCSRYFVNLRFRPSSLILFLLCVSSHCQLVHTLFLCGTHLHRPSRVILQRPVSTARLSLWRHSSTAQVVAAAVAVAAGTTYNRQRCPPIFTPQGGSAYGTAGVRRCTSPATALLCRKGRVSARRQSTFLVKQPSLFRAFMRPRPRHRPVAVSHCEWQLLARLRSDGHIDDRYSDGPSRTAV